MANFLSDEESGFFNALEVETEEGIEYDRVYTSEQFCEYFSLFVGNGVFLNLENQLMVSSGESIGSVGRNIVVNTGWAFINGMFYHNKEVGVLDISPNTSSVKRKDGVFCRFSKGDRSINVVVEEGRVIPKKLDYDYELLLAIVEVGPNVSVITNANITDKRPDETVCGFVKGLVDVIETNQLFQQFQSQFGEWFQNLQDFFGNDALGTVMSSIQNLQTNKVSVSTFNSKAQELESNISELEEGKVDVGLYEEKINTIEDNVTSLENDKSDKSKVIEYTIQTTLWSANGDPYVASIPVTGVTSTNIVEVSLSSSANINQIRSWDNANIKDGGQSAGSIILKAWGIKPEYSIPINIIVRGDV